MNEVTRAIDAAVEYEGSQRAVAWICDVTAPALVRWRNLGRFPRTDFTGETDYAGTISGLTGFQREKLIQASAIVWKRNKR